MLLRVPAGRAERVAAGRAPSRLTLPWAAGALPMLRLVAGVALLRDGVLWLRLVAGVALLREGLL